jgi:gliding motility-associated-like protein
LDVFISKIAFIVRAKSIPFFRIVSILLVFVSNGLVAQIGIQSGVDPEAMVENIVGDGVVYENVTYSGANMARGIFTNGGTTSLGIESGVFLTSGAGYIIPGPNGPGSCAAGSGNGMPGDATLTGLAGVSTYDAAVLEFDFIPESDTLRFKYVFGSEEYNEWVGSAYNDVFGFFVSGPDPSGGVYINKNVAIVPGTDPEIPIAINNVNNGYSSCDVEPTGPGSYPEFYSDNTFGLTLEYDGFTTVLTAFIRVVACETYHIKMAVADAGDGIYDTGIFLEENSFESPKIEVEIEPFPEGVSDNMVEGCVEADITFKLPNKSYAPITVTYEITGSATNGVDYETIPDTIFIPEGEDSASIHVVPVQDGIIEGDEEIILILKNELGCIIRYDTVIFTIVDYVDIETETTPTTAICEGQSIDIWCHTEFGISPYAYQWVDPPVQTDSILVSPDETTTYYVDVLDMCGGTATDSVTVVVMPMPEIELGNDTTLCGGDSLILHAGGGFANYIWQDGSNDSVYIVTEPGLYYVQVAAASGCSTADQINVDFQPEIILELGNDTIICQGETLNLNAPEGMAEYIWQDNSTESSFTATETGYYWVTVFNDFGCEKSDTLYLVVDQSPTTLNLGNDTIVCAGPYTIDPGFYLEYLWGDGSTGESLTITEEGTYSLTVMGGCNNATDSIHISFYPAVEVNLGADTNICAGSSLTLSVGFEFIESIWQDGSDLNSYNVHESGVYSVTVTDLHTCQGGDTIVVEVADVVSLPNDSTFCDGETISLDAGFGFDFYTWNTGSVSQVLNVTEGGTYIVNVAYVFGCESKDSIEMKMLPVPLADIGENQDICIGDTIVLIAPEGDFDYFWNGEQGEQTYAVSSGGDYTLSMSNICGEDSDEIMVTEHQIPTVDIGEDILLFPGESLQVDAGDFNSYLWQDGSTNRYFIVSYDEYHDSLKVEIFDGHCKNSDSIKVEIFDVQIPNVITPNGDGANDVFKPGEGWSGINSNKMIIYNRWGEKVWESSDFLTGWDGKNNGKYVAEGTYFWVLEVKYGNDNISKTYKGSVTVIGTN